MKSARRTVRSGRLWLAALILGTLVGCWNAGSAPAGELPAADRDGEAGVEVVFLANEGFLLRPVGGGDSVMIDGFLREEYSIYGALPGPLVEKLEAGREPFDRVRLALASHAHRDHFQATPAVLFLTARPDAILASSGQVLDALAEAEGEVRPRQLRRIALEVGAEQQVVSGGVSADVLRLDHGGRHRRTIENFGHLIHVGGRTILHIGDAAEDAEQFARYELPERGIDVALIPYWFFFEDSSRKVVAEHLGAALTIAAHIPPGEVEGVREALAESHPRVIVPTKALESWSN